MSILLFIPYIIVEALLGLLASDLPPDFSKRIYYLLEFAFLFFFASSSNNERPWVCSA